MYTILNLLIAGFFLEPNGIVSSERRNFFMDKLNMTNCYAESYLEG